MLLLDGTLVNQDDRAKFFFPALPSEHRAWSVNSRGMRKQKRENYLQKAFHRLKKQSKTKNHKTNTNQTNTNKHKRPTKPVKILAKRVKRFAPPRLSSHLFHFVVSALSMWMIRCPPCPLITLLRRVSHIRQESSPFELICVLSCLPPLCTVIHVCINLGTSILILAPECMYEATDVHGAR